MIGSTWLAAALLALAPGDTLRVPAGEHAAPVADLPDSVVVIGDPGAWLSGGVLLDHERGVVLEGLRISGPTGRALTATGTASVAVLDCEIFALPDPPVEPYPHALVGLSAPGSVLEDCWLHGGASHGVYLMGLAKGGPAAAGGVKRPDGTVLRRCRFTDIAKWAIHANNEGNGVQPTGILIEDCTAIDCGSGGLVLAMGDGAVVRGFTAVGCGTGVWLGYQASTGARLDDCLATRCEVGFRLDPLAKRAQLKGCLAVGNRVDWRLD